MIPFKCKICGGNLNIEQELKIATCEFCNSTHSLPNLSDQKKRNLYERANHLRRNHEFDKAMGMYETILTEDTMDFEAYWSLVLCKYGVEYVEDLKTKKRVITCHRTLTKSVFIDEDYIQALNYAPTEVKPLYQQEAKDIDGIQREIISISSQEEPYDIFICYKETDKLGKRTVDSVLAQDLYSKLSEEGYKVFFAKIILEDKLGKQFEPLIYSALKSSKVMLVLGTKKEHFEAPWVRNEWSRFLAMMKTDAKKSLIPLYRDMDAYDMPESFSPFQAQDIGKLGALQDIIRGIKKIIPNNLNNHENQIVSTINRNTSEASSINALLKRARIFLDDQDFKQANEYADKVLDLDPENSNAYEVKLLSEYKANTLENILHLSNLSNQFNNSKNFKNILRFGTKNQIEQLQKITNQIQKIERENSEKQRVIEEEAIKIASQKDYEERIQKANNIIKKGTLDDLNELESLLETQFDEKTKQKLLDKINERKYFLECSSIITEAKKYENDKTIRNLSILIDNLYTIIDFPNASSLRAKLIKRRKALKRSRFYGSVGLISGILLIFIKSMSFGLFGYFFEFLLGNLVIEFDSIPNIVNSWSNIVIYIILGAIIQMLLGFFYNLFTSFKNKKPFELIFSHILELSISYFIIQESIFNLFFSGFYFFTLSLQVTYFTYIQASSILLVLFLIFYKTRKNNDL